MVGGFVFPALGVDGFRSLVVSEHYVLQVLEKVYALIQAGICGVKPLVAFWGEQGRRCSSPVGVVDSYHVCPRCDGDDDGTRET